MKVKVKKISNAPQFYNYSTYFPKPSANPVSSKICLLDSEFMGILLARKSIDKGDYLFLSDGSLYGKRSDVLNHIAKIHMLPSGSVISLVSLTSGELTHWIITDTPTGYLRIPHFGEE